MECDIPCHRRSGHSPYVAFRKRVHHRVQRVEMTQVERIIDYMKRNGSITQIDAYNEIGCTRLPARISDIKAMGVGIDKVMETRENRFGEKVSFARYSLKKEDSTAVHGTTLKKEV